MGKSKQPTAPDLAGATREGEFANMETMVPKRQIESAYRLGTSADYIDPRTGETVTADFTGLGDIDITKAEARGLMSMIPEMSGVQLSNLLEFGPQFVEAQRDQMRQLDPEGFGLREEFAGELRRGEGTAAELVGEGVAVPEYLEAEAPVMADVGRTAEGRKIIDEKMIDQLMLDETLSEEQKRALIQGMRGASAARGQGLGAAGGLRESIAQLQGGMQLGQQRRGEAKDWYASGQSESDVANRLAQQNFSNLMQSVQQINQARGATAAGQQQNLSQQLAANQQGKANIQSLLGLAPVAAQGAQMAGLQQGASPFTMPQMQRGIGLDPGAAQRGAQFASNIFGSQAGMYEPSSPFGAIMGTALGGAAGVGGQIMGARLGLGKDRFNKLYS